MQIVIRLEQKDFEGNKEVFDRMYGLCSVLNKKTGPVEMTEDNTAEVEYTIEEVRKAFGEYAKSQGRDKAKGLLQEMGYDKVTEIPPERYTEAMTRIGDVK